MAHSNAFIFALALSVSGTVSCSELLGDVDIEALQGAAGARAPDAAPPPVDDALVDSGAPVAESAGSALASACEPGDVRCKGARLEICVRVDPGRPAEWLVERDCFTAELCVSDPLPRCLARGCNPGEVSCLGSVPRVCNASLTGWSELPACVSAAHCSADPMVCAASGSCCLPAPCSAGDLRCNGLELEQCLPDSSAWRSISLCETSELCQDGIASCRAGSSACTCAAAACEPNETRCNGNVLERCRAARSGWEVIDECATDELCLLGKARLAERCEAPACDPGEHSCSDGGVLRRCNAGRTGFGEPEECASAALCNPGEGRCEPALCQPDQFRCDGPQLQTCSAEQTGFVNVQACARPDLCSAERRRCDYCVPGRRECTPNLTASRVCSSSGDFFQGEELCSLGCIAATGACRR